MKSNYATLVLLGVVVSMTACERSITEDDPEDRQLGTFHAEAGHRSEGGFEDLEGSASFEMSSTADGTPVFLIRLASKLPNFSDTTALDFAMLREAIPDPGAYSFGDRAEVSTDFSDVFAGCFRSPNFESHGYASESGELIVSTANNERFEGIFDLDTYRLVQMGPSSFQRVHLEISGEFTARARSTGIDPEAILDCVE